MSATWTATVDEVVWTATDFPTVTFETLIRSATGGGGGGTVDVVSNVATGTILGRATAGTGDSEELSASSARTVMGLGTAATAAAADFLASGSGYNTANGWVKLDGSATVPDILIPSSIARDTEVASAVAALVDSSPGTLDTLNELAAALGDDPNFATTIATTLSDKQPLNSDLTAIAAVSGQTTYGRSLLTLADQPALVVAASGFTERSRFVTASTNDWPTFTSVPTADWYRLRWFREVGTPSASGGTVRNLILTLDGDSTSGNYFNTATSATSISVQAFGQGGGGFGQLLIRRVQFTSTIHGALVQADTVIATGTGSSAKASSAHSYRKAAGGVPDLSSWAIAASNNDTWAAGWTFILETGVDP